MAGKTRKGEDSAAKKKKAKTEQKEEEAVELLEDGKDEPEHADGDDVDETYSDLDDDQLLELALRDEEEDVKLSQGGEGEQQAKETVRRSSRRKKTYSKSNVLYLGHVPHGFYEHEMKAFLTQFGKVLQVRVSRSPKTGKSRGYAFVQFLHKEVADIVQKTMHGYILMGRSLVCQHVPEEHVHEQMFRGGLAGPGSVVQTYKDARKKRVLAHGIISAKPEAEKNRKARRVKADAKRKDRLAKKGIKYEFTGIIEDK